MLRLERNISDQDIHILTTLYQPLIGSTAYALYMALNESVRSATEWTRPQPLSTMLVRLDIGIPDFFRARVRLEGLGLLKIFRHRKNEDAYLYEIRPPMTATDFFRDNIMRLLLFEKVGETIYQGLREQFINERPSVKEYEEITQSFLDVYHFDIQKHNQKNQMLRDEPFLKEESPSIGKMITEKGEFDWTFFQEGLNQHFVNKQSITQEIKELIYTFAALYGIDELEMQRHILEATDVESGDVQKNKFISIVHRTFHKGQTQRVKMTDRVEDSIDEMKSQELLRRNTLKQRGFSEEELEIIEHAEAVTPSNYLNSIKQQKGGFVTSNEQWVLKELVEQAPLTTSVINILINYILVIKDEAVLEKSLTIKIANDWAQKEITSPEEAMEKVKQLYIDNRNRRAKRQKQGQRGGRTFKSTKNSGRKETLPKWASEEKGSGSDERVSDEEERAFKEQLRKIRSRKEKGGSN